MDLAAEMDNVIHMELGEPSFQTPDHIMDAGCKAIREGFTKYTANNGLKSLREAVVGKLERDGVTVDLEQIGISPGSVFALAQALLACTNPGDEILLSDPGWPNYYMQAVATDRKAVMYPLREECNFEPRIEDLETAGNRPHTRRPHQHSVQPHRQRVLERDRLKSWSNSPRSTTSTSFRTKCTTRSFLTANITLRCPLIPTTTSFPFTACPRPTP